MEMIFDDGEGCAWRPHNDLRGNLTSDLKSATLITLVSMCTLPPMASEAMATS